VTGTLVRYCSSLVRPKHPLVSYGRRADNIDRLASCPTPALIKIVRRHASFPSGCEVRTVGLDIELAWAVIALPSVRLAMDCLNR
jgi:hypothetical protein